MLPAIGPFTLAGTKATSGMCCISSRAIDAFERMDSVVAPNDEVKEKTQSANEEEYKARLRALRKEISDAKLDW